jgi:hypothetical protein
MEYKRWAVGYAVQPPGTLSISKIGAALAMYGHTTYEKLMRI